jgi:hypothetical protein
MATPDEMLRAIHAANPKTTTQRYNPAQLTAAFNAIKKPATKPPPQTPPPDQGQPVQQTPATVQNSALNGISDAIGHVGQGSLTGTNPNESGSTQSTIDATFNQLTQNNDSDMAREKANLAQSLANKGIPIGSEAYNDQMGQLNNRYDTLKANARNQAVLSGNQEYNSLYQNQLGGQAQNDSDIGALGGLQNTLVQQGFDAQKVKAIFDQLKINKQQANTAANLANRRYAGGGGGGGGDVPQTPVDDPFGA